MIRRKNLSLIGLSLLVTSLLLAARVSAEPELQLRRGDRVCYVGNALADRMQHVGWLETLIQSRFPQHQLVFRNLGFPADEIDKRPRSANFGSADQWLTKLKADVVFAFFGYNESFAGDAGLKSFRDKLTKFIDQTQGQKYNGISAPQLVLFSPIAHENLRSPHLSDGSENNARLLQYTQAMAEVAAGKGVVFVDLFNPTRSLYATAKQPLTINGVHLNPEGDRMVAHVIDRQLFGEPMTVPTEQLEKLREAVVDKNFIWFNRYRTVDGYNVYGGRSKLAWHGQSNADVMQREMEIFDDMTANRDKRIWAVAAGGDLKVDDSNTPPLLTVKTNKPGPLDDGAYPFLGGEEAIGKMTVAGGMQVNLFASEEQFPDLVNPVQMSVDADGRLWVATWPTYPHWNPKEEMKDKIVILPDDDGDGKADKCIVFADGLNSVTGFEFWGGGVIVAAAPELLFLKDTDGDDRADVRIRMLNGVSSADSHHTANSLTIGPDGGLYSSHGIFHVDNMETPTKTFRSTASGVFRFDPRTFEVDFHYPIGPNPHGNCFDQWGYQFASDGTSGTGAYVSIGKGVKAPKDWYKKRVRPVPAIGILSSSHFPEKHNGNFLICNAIGFLGVLQHTVQYDGADINAVETEPILVSADPNFRPTDLEVGGDGALYVSDWCNPLIGHMQHNIRDPNRDHRHGRVYRVTARGRDLLKPVKMTGKPIDEVLPNFYAKENGTRYRARLELSGRETSDVTAAVSKWAANIEPNTPADEQALLEALWVFEEHRVPNEALLKKVFRAQEPRVRAAAIRTLGHWGPKIMGWETLLLAAAQDGEPLVRAEAVKAAVSFDGLSAAAAIFEAANRPTDVQLEFVLKYAKGKINVDAVVQDTLKSGKPLSLAAQTYVLRNASVNDLLKMERSEAVYQAILSRSSVPEKPLREALTGLAKMRKVHELDLVLNLLDEQDAQGPSGSLETLGSLLVEQSAADLKAARDRVVRLASSGRVGATRQAGYAAWIAADGSLDDALALASRDKESLRDLLQAIPRIPDENLRGNLFAAVRPLAFELPPNLESENGGSRAEANGIHVDYFYPSASDVSIETLARMKPQASGIVPEIKMDVPQLKQRDRFALRFTGDIRVAKKGKYTFYANSDDGSRIYIGDQLVVDNDGLHGMSEKRGTVNLSAGPHPIVVTYFDNGGGDGLVVSWSGPGFGKQLIPTASLIVPGVETLHDVAIRAFGSIPGHETEKFNDLATLIMEGKSRTSAVRAAMNIPENLWPQEAIQPLAKSLAAQVSEIPARDRTGRPALDAMHLGDMLAAKLPKDERRRLHLQLADLKVNVIRIGTIPERMIFNKERLAVEAGKPVEFVFTNTDHMPHNFAIAQPGSLEEVGLLAEATAEDKDAMDRHYVPKSDKILLASWLLQPGETQALSFQVPTTPGIYPYVCTYPGHWRRMYGALYVVADLKDYLSDPEDYLARHPLPLRDELLKYNERDTEWTFEELASAIAPLHHGRSYDVGRNVFKVANCVACHKINDEGHVFGPDLTKLDEKKHEPDYLLQSILEPSKEIEEKYRSSSFVLLSGKVITGMVVEETPDELKVAVDPLASAEPVVIRKEDIEIQKQSEASLMPKGLLNKLSREEILDLIAYVLARGNKQDELFHSHQHH